MDPQESIFDKDWSSKFEWYEYTVFAVLLATSMSIGVFYGFFGSKNTTNEEFLMAGRSMPVFPVALSVLCSFISAVTLLGNPVEIYFYGFTYVFTALAFIIMGLALAYLYVPVYFRLQLISVFEYFEMRFHRSIRVMASISQICHGIIYMPLTVYGPALALEEVTGINKLWTSAIIFVVCIAYSSMGGLKAVLWTDALQGFVMLFTMLSIIIVGVNSAGGLSNVWKISEEGGRTDVLNFDWDLRTRHTFWTSIIGGYFNWIALFGATQAQIQRYLSVPTLEKARQVILVTVIGLMFIIISCSFTGLVIYANYWDCDPIKIEAISSSDQLLPLFVMDKLGDIPVLPGLFVAGLTAGSLSSVSSTLNSLAAIITEDFVKKYRPNLNQVQLGFVSKITSLVCGILAFVMIFVIAAVGNILPFSSLLHGTLVGPILGCFTLGMFFPWSNWLGIILALFPTLSVTLLVGIGSIMANNDKKLPNQKLYMADFGCYNETITSEMSSFFMSTREQSEWKNEEYSGWINLVSISYLWQPLIPIVSTVVFGALFSCIVGLFIKPEKKSKERYFSTPILRMWEKIVGKERLREYVLYEDEDEDFNGANDKPYMHGIPRASLSSAKAQALYGTTFTIPEIKVSAEDEHF